MFKHKYSTLLNCVTNDSHKNEVLGKLSQVTDCDSGRFLPVQSPDVMFDIIRNLNLGKSPGIDGLTAEHLLYACDILRIHLYLCINIMLRHNCLSDKLTYVVIMPIVKNKSCNMTQSDNYRPIAMATVMSKILERIILQLCEPMLYTSDSQFAFKSGHSTDMCIYILPEVVNFYRVSE